jgi:hypothetical protein
MALLYKIDDEQISSPTTLILHGRLRVPGGHPFATEFPDTNGGDGIMPIIRKATHEAEGLTVNVDMAFDGLGTLQETQIPRHKILFPRR